MGGWWKKFSGFALWARLVIGLAVVLLVVGLSVRFVSGLRTMIFGDTGAKKAEATEFVWETDIDQLKKTGKAAQGTVIDNYRQKEQITRKVEGGKSNVSRVDKGQLMDPEIDAATSDGLCQLNASLCRVRDDGQR